MKLRVVISAALAGLTVGVFGLGPAADAATYTKHFTFEVKNTWGRVIGNADWIDGNTVRFNDIYVYDYCEAQTGDGDGHGQGAYAVLQTDNGQSFGRNWINSQGCGTSKHWADVTLSRDSDIDYLQIALCHTDGTELTGDCNISYLHYNPFT